MSLKVKSNGINFNVPTIEDLPTERLEEDLVCVVTDKNRGGVFVYREANALINNGGTIFNGWTRQYDGSVNVKWFGAKGDGVTDDTVAMQNAINTKYNVYIPSGVYLNNTSINLSSGQEFFGDGKSSMISMSVNSNGHVIGIIGTTGNPIKNCHIHNMSIDCHSVINLNGIGIAYAENNIVDNVWVFNAGRKAYTMQYEVFNNILSNCYADGGASSYPIVSLEDPTDTGLCQRNIVNNITIGTAVDWVLSLSGASNNIITNVICKSSLRGLLLYQSDYNTIEHIITSCTSSLFQLSDSHYNKATMIKNNGISTANIFNFVTAVNTYNVFDGVVASGTTALQPYTNFCQNNTWKNCALSTSSSTTQFIGLSSGSTGNTFYNCTMSNAGNRVALVDASNTSFIDCTISAPVTAIKLGTVDGSVIRNCKLIGTLASYAIEGTTHTNSSYINNTKTAGTVQVNDDTNQLNNSWNGKIMYDTAVPATLTFKVGDIVYNTNPIAAGTIGWVCTTAGTPGTWKTFGAITA